MAWREALKKPAAKPAAPKPKFDTKDDDWETDTAYQNSATEKTQRYGSTSVPGSGRVDHVDFNSIQEKIKTADDTVKEVYQEKNPNRGYGGKYGTEQVMDKTAADFSYKADVKKHSSQTDGKKGFGGEHGIDERAADKSAVGFDYKAPVEKHSSQTDSSKGFGGKYGTDQNVQDKSAVGFSHKETLPKHSSQKDYTAGFGGKYGVQKEEPSQLPPTPSPEPKVVEKTAPSTSSKADVGNIRARFENMKKEPEVAKRAPEEKSKHAGTEKQLQQKQQVNTDDQENLKQQEASSETKETSRESSPARPKTPEVTTSNLDDNDDNKPETQTLTEKEEPSQLPPKPSSEPKVVEKTAPSTSSKADVGNIRARFENMKKEQEAEAAKRVAEERSKRTATDKQLQQKQQTNTNDQAKMKQQQAPPETKETSPETKETPPEAKETPPETKETSREPSPARPETPPPPEVTTSNSNDIKTETSTTNEEKEEQKEIYVGGLNITALLRHRKTSSSSSKSDDDDWLGDKNKKNQQENDEPSSTRQLEQPTNADSNDKSKGVTHQKNDDDDSDS